MTEFAEVKDSGERQEFLTGSRRDTREGKGRYDLLPPYAIFRLACHYSNGSKKYGDHNWLKGQPISRYVDSALRHIFKYLEGQVDEDHAIAAVWNMLAVVQTEEMVRRGTLPQELVDLGECQKLYGVAQPQEAVGIIDNSGCQYGHACPPPQRGVDTPEEIENAP